MAGRKANHWPTPKVEIKSEWSNTATSPDYFIAWTKESRKWQQYLSHICRIIIPCKDTLLVQEFREIQTAMNWSSCSDQELHFLVNISFRESYSDIHYLLVNLKGKYSRWDIYSSRSIVRAIKPKRVRWAGHVTRMGERRRCNRVSVEKPERREWRRGTTLKLET